MAALKGSGRFISNPDIQAYLAKKRNLPGLQFHELISPLSRSAKSQLQNSLRPLEAFKKVD